MSNMFYRCNALGVLDVSKFNTKNVENIAGMFARCNTLTKLNLSNFDTGYVEKMKEMFYNCVKLKTIRVGYNWTTANVMDGGENMFLSDTSLVGGMGTKFGEGEHVDKEYARIDDPDAMLPGFLTGPEHSLEDERGNSAEPQPIELTEEKVEQICAALGSMLSDDIDVSTVEVFTVNESDDYVDIASTLRDIDELSKDEKEEISKKGGVPAAILPEMIINQSGVCCFVVSLDSSIPDSDTLEWHYLPQDNENGENKLAAVFMKDGWVIRTVPADHEVEVAAYFEEGTYAPVIVATANGGGGGGDDGEIYSVGSGGGCNIGLCCMWLLFLIPVLTEKRL